MKYLLHEVTIVLSVCVCYIKPINKLDSGTQTYKGVLSV